MVFWLIIGAGQRGAGAGRPGGDSVPAGGDDLRAHPTGAYRLEWRRGDTPLVHRPAVLARDLDYVREHMQEKGFEQRELAKLTAQGLSPAKAHAVAAYFRAKLQKTDR